MGTLNKPAVGDRVRVILEGEVGWVGENYFEFATGADYIAHSGGENVVSIEKIEPPVEVFKPGDVVRHKDSGGLYTIAAKGYVSHRTADFNAWGFGVGVDFFTSKGYEKVSLG